MLKSLVIKVNKMVVVVRVNKVLIVFGEHKARAYMQLWQHGIVRVTYVEHLFGIKVKVTPLFVTQVGIGITVSDDLAWVLTLMVPWSVVIITLTCFCAKNFNNSNNGECSNHDSVKER